MQLQEWTSVKAAAIALICGALASISHPVAAQDDMQQQAERWGRIHAAAIYCRIQTAHEFGLSAVNYFKRSGGFEKLRETYGLALLNASHTPPARDIGGDCDGLRKVYNETWTMLKGG